MLNFQLAHKYLQSIALSSLVAWEDDDKIYRLSKEMYPLNKDIDLVRKNKSTTLLIDTTTEKIVAHNGTQSWGDWKNNLKASCNEYFHKGISEEYFRDVSPTVLKFAEGSKIPIKIYGHSQGDSSAKLSNLDLREQWPSMDVESISYCGPGLFTPEGVKRMKAAKCRVTDIIMPGDLVDNVAGLMRIKKFPFLAFAGRYGYKVKLPKVESDIVFGHKWSHAVRSLRRQFEIWKIKDQEIYFDYIVEKKVCKL